jgi:hypothetical protein
MLSAWVGLGSSGCAATHAEDCGGHRNDSLRYSKVRVAVKVAARDGMRRKLGEDGNVDVWASFSSDDQRRARSLYEYWVDDYCRRDLRFTRQPPGWTMQIDFESIRVAATTCVERRSDGSTAVVPAIQVAGDPIRCRYAHVIPE